MHKVGHHTSVYVCSDIGMYLGSELANYNCPWLCVPIQPFVYLYVCPKYDVVRINMEREGEDKKKKPCVF